MPIRESEDIIYQTIFFIMDIYVYFVYTLKGDFKK